MTDREMLELAAKAADILAMPFYGHTDGKLYLSNGCEWNPLTDDGDTARLEAALEIHFHWKQDRCVMSFAQGWVMAERYSDHNGDKQKAMRYASTKVAAEIGRSMREAAPEPDWLDVREFARRCGQ